jgi:hypothetical protein
MRSATVVVVVVVAVSVQCGMQPESKAGGGEDQAASEKH